nr:unknown [Zea mays]
MSNQHTSFGADVLGWKLPPLFRHRTKHVCPARETETVCAINGVGPTPTCTHHRIYQSTSYLAYYTSSRALLYQDTTVGREQEQRNRKAPPPARFTRCSKCRGRTQPPRPRPRRSGRRRRRTGSPPPRRGTSRAACPRRRPTSTRPPPRSARRRGPSSPRRARPARPAPSPARAKKARHLPRRASPWRLPWAASAAWPGAAAAWGLGLGWPRRRRRGPAAPPPWTAALWFASWLAGAGLPGGVLPRPPRRAGTG